MRLDVYLFSNGLALSRNEAKALINLGAVTVNGKTASKPALDVTDTDNIQVDRSKKQFVSRGGEKLEEAIRFFNIPVKDRLCIDVGASSGGFTDCLLQHGAKHVIAVDSGKNQLVKEISTDPRVTSIEEYNARYMLPEDFGFIPDLAVMDVSFISATLIIPSLYKVLSDSADFILLIKPQFEVGRQNIGKGGIVKDEKARREAIDRVVDTAITCGFTFRGLTVSPIKGGDGNIEYLAYFSKGVD